MKQQVLESKKRLRAQLEESEQVVKQASDSKAAGSIAFTLKATAVTKDSGNAFTLEVFQVRLGLRTACPTVADFADRVMKKVKEEDIEACVESWGLQEAMRVPPDHRHAVEVLYDTWLQANEPPEDKKARN